MKNIFLIIMLSIAVTACAQKKYYMLVGTYTSGKSKGIYVYDYNAAQGSATLVDSVITSNPSYLDISPDRNTIYAVNEEGGNGMHGRVTSFSFDRSTGHLKELGTTNSMGDHPCYVAVDKTGKWVTAGNYSSGTAALYSVDGNHRVNIKTSLDFNNDDTTEKDSHIHATVFSKDNKYIFMPDLGKDRIWIFKFDEKKGNITPVNGSFVSLQKNSGPRHMVFHPNGKWVYLVQELSGTVTMFNYNQGQLKKVQSLSSLPPDYSGPARSADIHVSPDGNYLYASNRDPSNNIVIFKINKKTGMLTLAGHQSTLGKTPRNFNFDPSGNFLFVANQNSNNIVVFRVDHTTGLLKDTGNRIDVGSPVCVKWILR